MGVWKRESRSEEREEIRKEKSEFRSQKSEEERGPWAWLL
jgi:hypothetical protein